MSEIEVIAIAKIDPSIIEMEVEELVTVRIKRTPEGQYFFPESEQEVIDMLLKEILENARENSKTCLAVEIPRRRRRRPPKESPSTPTEYSRRRSRRGGGV